MIARLPLVRHPKPTGSIWERSEKEPATVPVPLQTFPAGVGAHGKAAILTRASSGKRRNHTGIRAVDMSCEARGRIKGADSGNRRFGHPGASRSR